MIVASHFDHAVQLFFFFYCLHSYSGLFLWHFSSFCYQSTSGVVMVSSFYPVYKAVSGSAFVAARVTHHQDVASRWWVTLWPVMWSMVDGEKSLEISTVSYQLATVCCIHKTNTRLSRQTLLLTYSPNLVFLMPNPNYEGKRNLGQQLAVFKQTWSWSMWTVDFLFQYRSMIVWHWEIRHQCPMSRNNARVICRFDMMSGWW